MQKKDIKTQSRAEKFSLVAGIIALLTSVIQLITAAFGIGANGQQITLSPLVITLIGFGLGYGWFLVSWFIIRRFFLSQIEDDQIPSTRAKPYRDDIETLLYRLSDNEKRDLYAEIELLKKFREPVYRTVIAIGIVLLPVGIAVTWYWILIAPIGGLGIWLVARLLMPTIYPDMQIIGFD